MIAGNSCHRLHFREAHHRPMRCNFIRLVGTACLIHAMKWNWEPCQSLKP